MPVRRNQRPVFVLDLRPDFGGQAGGGDRARIPAPRGRLAIALARLLIGFGDLGAALLESALAIGGEGSASPLRSARAGWLRRRR